MKPNARITNSVEALYRTFAAHSAGTDFCRHCYSEEDISYFTKTPLREIDDENARTLLYECHDHWENPSVFRHFLPRIFELYAPPALCEDMYPEHLFETLIGVGFHGWPDSERLIVLEFLKLMEPLRCAGPDKEEWSRGFSKLSRRPEV
jgi:hypothetical protein